MKKMITFILAIMLAFSTKGQKIKFSLNLDKDEIREDLNITSNKLITFEGMFNNDVLSLQIDKKTIYNEKISTNQFDGVAYEYVTIKPKRIRIGINNQFICLLKKDYGNYKYIYVSKKNDVVKVDITNKVRFYK